MYYILYGTQLVLEENRLSPFLCVIFNNFIGMILLFFDTLVLQMRIILIFMADIIYRDV